MNIQSTKVTGIGGFLGSLISTLPLMQEVDQIARLIGVPMQASDSVGQINSLA
jgi:hypothetical protein